MKTPRVTVLKLLGLVAVVAVDLAVGRVLWRVRPNLALAVAVSGPALPVGLYRLCVSRGPGRAFWVGFGLAGSAAVLSLYLAMTSPYGPPWFWRSYTHLAMSCLRRLPVAPIIFDGRPTAFLGLAPWDFTVIAILSPPQLIAALVGGLLTRLIARLVGPARRYETLSVRH